jgi:methionine-rich copper-binding protein CopC
MKTLFASAAAAALLFSVGAQAHTHVEKTMPADKSTVKTSPKEIMLHFNEAALVTSLSIQKDGEEAKAIKPLPTEPSAMVSVPVSALSPGKYTVTYRVMGDDKHVMSGTLHFTVAAP